MKRTFVLSHSTARNLAVDSVKTAPEGYVVTVRPPARSLDQNSRMWAMLTEVSLAVDWHGQRLAPEEWKDVFTAALKRQKVVPGLDGGFVVLGSSTSRMTKPEMGELMDLMEAFGAERGVTFDGEKRSGST